MHATAMLATAFGILPAPERPAKGEKYPGQSTAYLKGAWRGDGVVPPLPKRTAERLRLKEDRRRLGRNRVGAEA